MKLKFFWSLTKRSSPRVNTESPTTCVVMQETNKAAQGEGLWDLYTNELVITAELKEDAVRKFGVWK